MAVISVKMPKICYRCGQIGHVRKFCEGNGKSVESSNESFVKSIMNSTRPMREIKVQECDFNVTMKFYSAECQTMAFIQIEKDGKTVLQKELV